MAIFTAIGGAIAGALFTSATAIALATSVIAGALAFGTQLAVSYLTRPKKRSYSAVQGEAQFGGNVPVGALFGIGKIRGQRLYWAKWGSGNKFNVDVWALSNGWCDGLEPEVYFYGKKHTLNPIAKIGGETAHYEVSGFGSKLRIRFYDGRPGQTADARLVSVTAGLGSPWRATSRCSGITYVIVEREWNEELFSQGQPDIEFILRGLRLYDPRRDATVVGGSGAHRLNDPSTWQFSHNPALQRLNYQLGLRGLISQRTLIGEGKSLGQIDLGTYFAAMNVCDTLRNGKPTYQAALYVNSDDDHTEVLKEFDDAMAGYGLNRRGLSGVIAGAPQIPVASITAADIPVDRAQQVQLRKSSFDLYNHLSGQFISKEDQWNPASLKPVYVNADVAADGRPRQTSNDFLQVSDPDIAQYLLTIRYRQNRKGGTATVPVSRRLGLKVQEGEWITFEGRTWLIREWQCDEGFNITLVLAETGADIYAEGGIEPGPIVIPSTPPINPSLLSRVLNFAVEVGTIKGSSGNEVPALRFTWAPPQDPTITHVIFEYFIGNNPTGQKVYTDRTDNPEAGEYITSKDVVPGVLYTARATIRTVPDRFKSFTQWLTTDIVTGSMKIYPIDLDQLAEEVKNLTKWIGDDTRILRDKIEALATNASDQDLRNYDDKATLRREVSVVAGNITAAYTEAINVAVGPGSAIASQIETLTVEIASKASVEALNAVTVQIEEIDGIVTAQAASIQQLSVDVEGKASANAFNALYAQINEEGGIAERLSGVEFSMAGTTASGRFRMSAGYTPAAGWSARLGMEVRVDSGSTYRSAGFFMDVTATTARVVFDVNQFIITDGTANVSPFVFSGGVAYMENARIGTVYFNQLMSTNGKLLIKGFGTNASIEIFT